MKALSHSSRESQNPNSLRNLVLLAFSFFAWGIGEGLFFYFQPIYLQELGATPVLIGSILGLNGLAMTLVQTPAGYLADKIGNRQVMLVAWGLGTLAAMVMAFSNSLIGFSIGWIVYGFSAMNAATSSYITNVRGKMSVGRALTLVSSMYHLGAFIGPRIGGQIGQVMGLRIIYRVSVALFIISSIIILFTGSDRTRNAAVEHPKQNLIRQKPFMLLLLVSFITIFSGYLAEPLTPNFLQDIHQLSLLEIGQLGSIGSLGNATISLIFGGMNPIFGILIGHAFLGVFSFSIWQGTNMVWFSIGFFLRGGYRIYQAMYLSLARNLLPSRDMGLVYGVMATVNSIAIILAPPIAGLIYEIKPHDIYPVSLSLILITLITNVALSRKFWTKNKDAIKGNIS